MRANKFLKDLFFTKDIANKFKQTFFKIRLVELTF